jgi:DNA-binding response OmpR family regulator
MARQPRVAFVDDDPRLRSLITDELTDEGVEAIACRSGQELLDLLEGETVDLILLDLMMPVMDGMTCLKHLKGRKKTMPILIATSLNEASKRRELIELGANDYIFKPDLFDLLPSLLDQYLPSFRKQYVKTNTNSSKEKH